VTVTVTPATDSIRIKRTQQFTASVQGTASQAVTWTVNGVPGGNSTIGTISSTGLYTAPAIVPSPSKVTVTATSVAVPSASGSAIVTIRRR